MTYLILWIFGGRTGTVSSSTMIGIGAVVRGTVATGTGAWRLVFGLAVTGTGAVVTCTGAVVAGTGTAVRGAALCDHCDSLFRSASSSTVLAILDRRDDASDGTYDEPSVVGTYVVHPFILWSTTLCGRSSISWSFALVMVAWWLDMFWL